MNAVAATVEAIRRFCIDPERESVEQLTKRAAFEQGAAWALAVSLEDDERGERFERVLASEVEPDDSILNPNSEVESVVAVGPCGMNDGFRRFRFQSGRTRIEHRDSYVFRRLAAPVLDGDERGAGLGCSVCGDEKILMEPDGSKAQPCYACQPAGTTLEQASRPYQAERGPRASPVLDVPQGGADPLTVLGAYREPAPSGESCDTTTGEGEA